MSSINALQMAAVISLTVDPPSYNYQLAAVVSTTTIPAINAYQLAAVVSLSPGTPHVYAPQRINQYGPLSIVLDMPKVGDNKNG